MYRYKSTFLKFCFEGFINLFRKPHAHAFAKQAAEGCHVRGADGWVKIDAW